MSAARSASSAEARIRAWAETPERSGPDGSSSVRTAQRSFKLCCAEALARTTASSPGCTASRPPTAVSAITRESGTERTLSATGGEPARRFRSDEESSST